MFAKMNNLGINRHVKFSHCLLMAGVLIIAFQSMDLIRGVRAATTIQNSVAVVGVSAASFTGSPAPMAPNSIVAAFGTQLATGTLEATPGQPLPTTLLTTTVTVNGTPAQLFFVSPGQINLLIPSGVPAGNRTVVVTSTLGNGDQIVSSGQLNIASTAPAIFTANASGFGPPAAVTGRIINGQFVYDSVLPFAPDPVTPGQYIPNPIDVGTAGNPAFLIIYGTGLRAAPGGNLKAIIGGIEVNTQVFVAAGYTGLDQINLQIPVSLKGAGIVDLTLVIDGVSSNAVKVNMAGTPNSGLSISGFSVSTPALAGQTVTIQGAGFSTTVNQNIVRFGSSQARVIAATPTQLTVIVPFGAESGKVTIATQQGEATSTAIFKVKTSISGLVQSTGTGGSQPVPLDNVTVRVSGTSISVRTNPQGIFVLADLPVGPADIEIDGGTTNVNPPYPSITLKAVARADKDSQFSQPISLQQITGGGGNVGGSGLGGGSRMPGLGQDLNSMFLTSEASIASGIAIRQQITPGGKSVLISDRGVTLEVPPGASIRFPDGKTIGRVQVTVIQGSRLPGINLPAGVYTNTIAQITPFGTTFSPGASLSFPNPDPNKLGAGAKVDLYRYDFKSGSFIKRGTATVTTDKSRVVSDGRVVDIASLWLITAPAAITTVRGRVIDNLGFAVPGALASVNGKSDLTDQNGGFVIRQVALIGTTQIQAEAVLPQQYGKPPRGLSSIVTAVNDGITNVGTIALSDTNQAALVLSPFLLDFNANSPPAKMEVTLTQPAPTGGLLVSLSSDDNTVASVPQSVTIPAGQTTTSFNVTRVGPGITLITALASLSGNKLETIAVVTVSQPAPQLRSVSPQAAPTGARIRISGTGLSPIPDNNIIGFLRKNSIVAILDPTENEVIFDAVGNFTIQVKVPDIGPGDAGIAAAVIDDLTGAISDVSAQIGFNVLAADVTAPRLTAVQPAEGKPRDQVTITGTGFSTTAAEDVVIFRQGTIESEARVIRALATSLLIEVPAFGVSKGSATIVVRIKSSKTEAISRDSNSLNFNITADPATPGKPVLSSVINARTQVPSGRDGDIIVASGSGLGKNFLNLETGKPANTEPLATLLLFYQNNEVVNFSFPLSATGGTSITGAVPSGLAAGAAQITALTFDLESGLLSDESAPVNFTITQGSLFKIDEEEPNDSVDTATVVTPPVIVTGSAAKTDTHDLIINFTDGTSEPLPDLFYLSLTKQTNMAFSLKFNQTADLDLFVFEIDVNGEVGKILKSSRGTGTTSEDVTIILPAGDYIIAVGAFSGNSNYALTFQENKTVNFNQVFGLNPELFNFKQPAKIEKRR